MSEENKTVWTVILILIAGACWAAYHIYKHLFIPWRNRRAIIYSNERTDRREMAFVNRRLSGYLSRQTSSSTLTQPDSTNNVGVINQGIPESCLEGPQGGFGTNVEGLDQPPTYMYVTHNQSEFLHDPPTYEEATKQG